MKLVGLRFYCYTKKPNPTYDNLLIIKDIVLIQGSDGLRGNAYLNAPAFHNAGAWEWETRENYA